jgi:hypothetical protein
MLLYFGNIRQGSWLRWRSAETRELITSAKLRILTKEKAAEAMNGILIGGVRVAQALLLPQKCRWE